MAAGNYRLLVATLSPRDVLVYPVHIHSHESHELRGGRPSVDRDPYSCVWGVGGGRVGGLGGGWEGGKLKVHQYMKAHRKKIITVNRLRERGGAEGKQTTRERAVYRARQMIRSDAERYAINGP